MVRPEENVYLICLKHPGAELARPMKQQRTLRLIANHRERSAVTLQSGGSTEKELEHVDRDMQLNNTWCSSAFSGAPYPWVALDFVQMMTVMFK